MPARSADKAAIVSFFNLLGGPHWLRNEAWDPSGKADPCVHKWEGVDCIDPCRFELDGNDCFYGRITALRLSDNNLTGDISTWTGLGELHNLSSLDLSHNSIHGRLPTELGNIPSLDWVDLKFNSLEGTLPPGLFSSGLRHGYHEEHGLDSLLIEHNKLSGTLPPEIGLRSHLVHLNAGNNRLSGSIPPQITNLTLLEGLNLGGGGDQRIGGTLPAQLGNLVHLRILNISSGGALSGTLPTSIGGLTEARSLFVQGNVLSGALPTELGGCTMLRKLYLADNLLDGNLTTFDTLGRLTNLETLDLFRNRLVGDVPSGVQKLAKLKMLYVDTAQLSLVRRGYCHERFGNYRYDGDRVNHVGLRDQFAELEEKAESCTNPYSEDLAFGTLMDTDLYAD